MPGEYLDFFEISEEDVLIDNQAVDPLASGEIVQEMGAELLEFSEVSYTPDPVQKPAPMPVKNPVRWFLEYQPGGKEVNGPGPISWFLNY